jgi:alkylated DNA repair protein alkB family protein 5
LVLKGNGADMAKHCIPSVKARRISITLRKQPPVGARHQQHGSGEPSRTPRRT